MKGNQPSNSKNHTFEDPWPKDEKDLLAVSNADWTRKVLP